MHTLLRYNPTDNLPLNCWGNFHLASMVDFFKPGMTASLLERIFVMSQFISSVLYRIPINSFMFPHRNHLMPVAIDSSI